MTTAIRDDRAAGATEVEALAAVEQRIEQLINERHRLAATFDALADRIRIALADGRSPLAQTGELTELDHRIQQLEGYLTEEMEKAAKKISTFSESEHGLAMLSVKAKTLKTAK